MAEDAVNIEKYVISMRRYFHEYPELSFQEEQTIERIKDELEEMGLKPQIIEKGGLYADIKGGVNGKTVALRADMDALPIREETDIPFKSKNDGVMHACGHDSHMAMLLGVAKSLVNKRDQFNGTVRLIFQRAEEQPPGGAVEMIRGGVLKNVDYVVGQHVMSNAPSGIVAILPKECMANADEFKIKINSKGGHGAYPHTGVDTLMIASLFVVQAQTIVSRIMDPSEPAVITVGTMASGFRYNVISPHTELRGTVRTFSEEGRDKSEKYLKEMIQNLCITYGADFEFEFIRGYPALINNPELISVIETVARKIVGEKNIIRPKPSMGGEDFAYYAQQVPGAFYFLGVTNRNEKNPGQNHSPQFTIDESALGKGTLLMEQVALKLLSP
ncbi:MAG: M20 metallopeptidase family protein [Cuniculiplasma sp.]